MPLRKLLSTISLATLAASGSFAEGAPGCEVRLESVDASQVPTFRGECRWSVAPAFVATVLTDPALLAASSSSLEESRRLPDGRILNVQKTGWPLDDRQSTLEVTDVPLPGGGVRRRFHLASAQEPTSEGRVQVAVDEGSWEIRPAPGGGTELALVLRYEPGGNLPPDLVQRMSPSRIARGLDELRIAAEALARAPGREGDVAAGPRSR